MNKRPTFITIISIYDILIGVGIFAVQIMSLFQLNGLFSELDNYVLYALIAANVLGVLSISAGIGMLKGLKCGWYLGVVNHMVSIARNLLAVGYIVFNYAVLAESGTNLTRVITKHGIRVVVWMLLIKYFFDSKVLEYFGVTYENRKKCILKLMAISMGVVFLINLGGIFFK